MSQTPRVQALHHAGSGTFTYIVSDEAGVAAVIDPVLDFDPVSGRISEEAVDMVAQALNAQGLSLEWILETHIHADHVSGAPALKRRCGGRIAASGRIGEVYEGFREAFGYDKPMALKESGFDRLLDDGESIAIGALTAHVIETPGHTPACLTYVIGDAAFVGDTVFQPDAGTARCDFPGGDARTLYRSIRKLLETLPGETRVFVCHDYGLGGKREPRAETTIAAQRAGNIHVNDSVDEDAFVAMRAERDAKLSLPRLMLPSVQMNVRGGHPPDPDSSGISRLSIPINYF